MELLYVVWTSLWFYTGGFQPRPPPLLWDPGRGRWLLQGGWMLTASRESIAVARREDATVDR